MSIILFIFAIIAVVAMAFYGLSKVLKLSLPDLIVLTVGTIVGLIVGALLSIPLSKLPNPYGNIMPIIITLIIALAALRLFFSQREAFNHLFGNLRPVGNNRSAAGNKSAAEILVDTSVIIDGRIAD